MLEPKALFSTKGPVPKGEYFVPFGVANIVRAGSDLTIVTCGTPVHRAVEAAEQLAGRGNFMRSDRPADDRSAGRRNDRRKRGQDRPSVGRRRGVCDVRPGRRNRRGDDGTWRSTNSTRRSDASTPIRRPIRSVPIHEAAVVITTDRIVAGARGRVGGQANHSAPAARCASQDRFDGRTLAAASAAAFAGGRVSAAPARRAAASGRQQRPIEPRRPPRPAWR